jgi:hypothetical protein
MTLVGIVVILGGFEFKRGMIDEIRDYWFAGGGEDDDF